MSNIVFNEMEFETDLFKKLSLEVSKCSQRISYIADGGISKGKSYQQTIDRFTRNLRKGIDLSQGYTSHELLQITNEIASRRGFFDEIIEFEEFESFILLLKENKKISIYKRLFHIYFNYYSTLHKEKEMTVLNMHLKSILRNYNGKNRYLLNLKNSVNNYLFGSLPYLLEHYGNDYDKIKNELKLQDSFEISKAILNLKIIQELKLLKFDEINENIFNTIYERKDMHFEGNLSLKEFATRILINRAIDEAPKPFPQWRHFILKLVGDPRSMASYSSRIGSWDVIGEDQKNFFIKTLSKDDLKLFLEALSDSNSDNNYEYRKAFWLKFVDHVVFAKLMIGKDVTYSLSPEMKQQIQRHNDSYSKLKGLHGQSAIYIDFGNLHVIEFTHSGQVRGYNKCPINLHQSEFSKTDLDKLPTKHHCILAQIHSSPKTYTWQEYLLPYLNQYLGTHYTKHDIEIPQDRERRLAFAKKRGWA